MARGGERFRTVMWIAPILLLVPLPPLAVQDMLAMGDRTLGSVLPRMTTTLVAPCSCGNWHELWRTAGGRDGISSMPCVAAVLAWQAVLGVDRLLPVALWEV